MERKRDYTIRLPDEFLDFCEDLEVDPEDVIKGFVADLMNLTDPENGYFQHGSDERHLAWEYIMRQGYAHDWQDRTNYFAHPRFELMGFREAMERDKEKIARYEAKQGKEDE